MTENSNLASNGEVQLLDGDTQSMEEMVSNARAASDFLKAIAHEHRLLILCILAEGEKSVRELELKLNMRQPSVSQQLARLRAERLVATRREGKTIYYSLASEHARELISVLYRMFCGPKP
ncbi:metalloregulator ArsR/SmtB family transcription factor [Pelagibius sp. Alg239-R121]|uniref:ArsR/SmtB family transcription factor n=1 Tax=Pelagibius sp. Alg239-R121 TaxID=2993448 RepID=UPI002AC35D26|nr:metalloregulator ArsR/SmtB family transcription factor [Pelagibius sp. Alg239-R121]